MGSISNVWTRGKLLQVVKSFYIASRACIRVGNGVSERFLLKVGLRQGCVMSLWFNIYIGYMDGMVREVSARGLGRGLS